MHNISWSWIKAIYILALVLQSGSKKKKKPFKKYGVRILFIPKIFTTQARCEGSHEHMPWDKKYPNLTFFKASFLRTAEFPCNLRVK